MQYSLDSQLIKIRIKCEFSFVYFSQRPTTIYTEALPKNMNVKIIVVPFRTYFSFSLANTIHTIQSLYAFVVISKYSCHLSQQAFKTKLELQIKLINEQWLNCEYGRQIAYKYFIKTKSIKLSVHHLEKLVGVQIFT